MEGIIIIVFQGISADSSSLGWKGFISVCDWQNDLIGSFAAFTFAQKESNVSSLPNFGNPGLSLGVRPVLILVTGLNGN